MPLPNRAPLPDALAVCDFDPVRLANTATVLLGLARGAKLPGIPVEAFEANSCNNCPFATSIGECALQKTTEHAQSLHRTRAQLDMLVGAPDWLDAVRDISPDDARAAARMSHMTDGNLLLTLQRDPGRVNRISAATADIHNTPQAPMTERTLPRRLRDILADTHDLSAARTDLIHLTESRKSSLVTEFPGTYDALLESKAARGVFSDLIRLQQSSGKNSQSMLTNPLAKANGRLITVRRSPDFSIVRIPGAANRRECGLYVAHMPPEATDQPDHTIILGGYSGDEPHSLRDLIGAANDHSR